jgi:hypothetical protein
VFAAGRHTPAVDTGAGARVVGDVAGCVELLDALVVVTGAGAAVVAWAVVAVVATIVVSAVLAEAAGVETAGSVADVASIELVDDRRSVATLWSTPPAQAAETRAASTATVKLPRGRRTGSSYADGERTCRRVVHT